MLVGRAAAAPQRTGYTFLNYVGSDVFETVDLTYGGLLDDARSIAAALQRTCRRGDRVLVMCPAGLNYIKAFFGCVLAGMIAVPAYPPRNAKHMDRLQAIVADCEASAILAPIELIDRIKAWSGSDSQLPDIIALDRVDPMGRELWVNPQVQPDDLAFLQYTSGTTGQPKGVMVPHKSVCDNVRRIIEAFELSGDDRLVSWLPPFHDMGLVSALLTPLACGFPSILMAPGSFLQRPMRWLEVLSAFEATGTVAPNFGWQLCVDAFRERGGTGAASDLKLGTVRKCLSGAERVRPATLSAFVQSFGRFGFEKHFIAPVYGMAEIVVLATGRMNPSGPVFRSFESGFGGGSDVRRREQNLLSTPVTLDGASAELAGQVFTSCGSVIEQHLLKIVDPETWNERAAGCVGEIWLSGPSVAAGYWNKPELSQTVFKARLSGAADGPDYLRTGDLGAVIDGELYVLGRIKEMVIVRGRNHYAPDLEECANAADEKLGTDRTIAFGVERDSGEALVLVHELTRSSLRQFDATKTAQAVRHALLDTCEVDVTAIVFVKPATLPRTTSGKLQRVRARELFLANELVEVARWEAPARASPTGKVDAPFGPPQVWRVGDLESWLQAEIGAALGVPAERVPLDAGFAELGLDSLRAIQLVTALGGSLGRHIETSELYDTPTIAALARRLSGKTSALPPHKEAEQIRDHDDRVAIVGLSCRFPGAADAESFWRLLRDGAEGIGEIPKQRWDLEAYFDPDPDVPGKIYTRRAGLLPDLDKFDPAFFGISPREAAGMDPQQRLLLEASWWALENAGMSAASLRGSRTGVYVGVGPSEYASLNPSEDPARVNSYSATGTSLSVTAGRVAYVLGLEGPAMAIDTACSSSLVALHQAVLGLQRGEMTLALAGGVNTILGIDGMLAVSRARMLSPDGRCKTFDATADGYVRAEGCGIVVLKRLKDAERDGDNILAVVRGSAVNQDGASAGLTVPNGPAQQRLIGDALARAGVAPSEIDYLEAHGTGTALGDPIEVRAAAATYGIGRSPGRPLMIGSVKTNIGHLEAAAGIAGLIKAVLSLQHGVIPKHLNFTTPSNRIDWASLPVKVTAEATPLPTGLGRPWRIGVSSFGFSGTNAHVILDSYGQRSAAGGAGHLANGPRSSRVLVMSGKTADALPALAAGWGRWLADRRAESGTGIAQLLADASYTAGFGRSHFYHRAAIAFRGPEDLAAGLAALAEADEAACAGGVVEGVMTGVRNPSAGSAQIGFLFTGQGSQWAGMGLALYECEPVFRAVLDRCEALVQELRGVSLLDVMFGREGAAGSLDDTQWTQPGLYALQVGLTALWASLGVRPAAVMGHSVGELAAAHAAGVFSLEDGLRLTLARGSLMGALPTEGRESGAMLAVFAPRERVVAALSRHADLSLAAENGTHRVISGLAASVDTIAEQLKAEGLRCERLRTSHAFHCMLMDPMLDELECVGNGLAVSATTVALISNVTGRLVAPDERLDGAYWRTHARAPVEFAQGIVALAGMGIDCLLEIGPRGVLGSMAMQCWPKDTPPRVAVSLDRRSDGSLGFARAVGAVYAAGAQLTFPGLFAGETRRKIPLPQYPFQRQRHWHEAVKARVVDSSAGFLLGPAVDVVANGQRIYPQRMCLDRQPWLADHRVYGAAVLPGMGYVAMALQAAGAPAQLEAVSFIEPLFLSDGDDVGRDVQLVLTPGAPGQPDQFEVLSRAASAGGRDWRRHATGQVCSLTTFASSSRRIDLSAIQAQARLLTVEELTALWSKLELSFGPSFAAVQAVWMGAGVSAVLIQAPAALRPYMGAEPVHAVLLDACIRFSADALSLVDRPENEGAFWAPWRIDSVSLSRAVPKEFYAYCETESVAGADGQTRRNTVLLLDSDGLCFGAIEGFSVRRAPRAAFLRALGVTRSNILYVVKWLAAAPVPTPRGDGLAHGSIAVLIPVEHDQGIEVLPALKSLGYEAIERVTADPAAVLAEMAATGTLAGVAGLVWVAPTGAGLEGRASSAVPGQLLSLLQEIQRHALSFPLGVRVVTQGAVATGAGEACDPVMSALWGMGRSLQDEAPGLGLRLVDVVRATIDGLGKVLTGNEGETQLALRGSQVLVPRLERANAGRHMPARGGRLVISARGSFDGLRVEESVAREPGPGEVRIAVRAAGLNFRDVLNVLGAYPGDPGDLGGEISGEVVAVGAGVTHLAAGDRVFGLVAGGFTSDLTVPAAMLRRLPVTVSHAGGATIPVTFVTARAAFDLAGLAPGERVLIHAGAGGVGMAAVQLARNTGAEIFVTASVSKHDALRAMGIRNVFDSRSTAFAGEILAATDGAGVNVILNSLTSEGFIAASLSCLGQGGRFVEIGKRDIWAYDQMRAYRADVTYHILAIDDWMRDTPEKVGVLLDDLAPQFASGDLQTLPFRQYPLLEAAAAMRLMANAGHIGKIVLSIDRPSVRPEASYLITGGFGALGREAANWLAEQGAGHIVLVSRRAPDSAAAEWLREVEAATGCKLVAYSLDIADAAAVRALIGRFGSPQSSWPKLAGIIHAAGVLDDGILSEQSPSRLAHVWNPKALGAWNLHEAVRGLDLDLFVLYSSVAATLGSPGQSNYAAANGFLDGLAALRRSQGLAATSVAWGPWSRGMADDARVRARLSLQGLTPLDVADAHVSLRRLLDMGAAGGVVLDADFTRLGAVMGSGRASLLSGVLGSSATAQSSDLLTEILALPPDGRQKHILRFLQGELQAVLGLAAPPDPTAGFFELGMDSLMAVEFHNRLARSCGSVVVLPDTLIFDYPSVGQLAGYMYEALNAVAVEKDVPESQASETLPEMSLVEDATVSSQVVIELDTDRADIVQDQTGAVSMSAAVMGPPSAPDHAHDRLAWLDHLACEQLRATRRRQLMQCIWLYDREVDRAGLAKTYERFVAMSFNRHIELSPLLIARPRWVKPAGPPEPIVENPEILPRTKLMKWASEHARLPIDPFSGPAWRIALQRFDDGTTAVSVVGSHQVIDGLGGLRAIAAAANGVSVPSQYMTQGTRGWLAGLLSDARQILADAPRTAAAITRLARANWRKFSPSLLKLGSDPRHDRSSLVSLPAVALSVDSRVWDDCSRRLGGSPNTLFAGFVAALASHLGRCNPYNGTVSLLVPVDTRRGLQDDRALAIEFRTLKLSPSGLSSDLRLVNEAFLASKTDETKALDPLLPAIAWMPQRVTKALVNELFDYTDSLPVSCSNIGTLPDGLALIDGAPCARMLTRAVDVNVTREDLERSNGHLVVVSSRYDRMVSVCIEACKLDPKPTTTEELRIAVLRTLADFQLDAVVEA
jgi:acyl transferase domain-containing protein/acyl-CoA synthetase (AMP-forming)/AMP-acid ligase II/NADPH:quinone reductase-like Zn-dependent oxidoreductase/acyl carrier protein